MNNIKVCHVTSVHRWNDVRIYYKESLSHARAGYEVSILAYDAPVDCVEGVNIISAGKMPQNRILRIAISWLKFYFLAVKYDFQIFHIHDPELLPLGFLLKKKGRKVIFDIHENIIDQIMLKSYIPYPIRKFVTWIYSLFERVLLPSYDFLIAAVPQISQMYKRKNYRVIDVQNLPRVEEFTSITHNWSEKEKILCYVGHLNSSRGAELMFKLMDKLPGWTLYLAGPVSEKNLLHKFKVHNSIRYLGILNRTEIASLFSKSIAGLLLFERHKKFEYSMPIKMFEYMAAALPVIATYFPYWEKFIVETQAGFLVDIDNVEEIAGIIEYLWQNKAEAEKIGLNGRKSVISKFNWSEEEKKLLNIYDIIVKEIK